jgi:hypothetical protein
MTKRTFFKSLMGAVAAVALAPEIAFGRRLELPTAELKPYDPEELRHFGLTHACNQPSTWYDTKRDIFFVFRDGKWVESGFEGQD